MLEKLFQIKVFTAPYLIAFAFLFASNNLASQVISISDSLFLESLRTELNLNATQQSAIDSLIISTSAELIEIDKESQRVARSSASQEERDSVMTDLRERKKSIKESRELSIRLLLTAEQLTAYDDKIKPGKPSVIHMGINHDRSNCNVCIPK